MTWNVGFSGDPKSTLSVSDEIEHEITAGVGGSPAKKMNRGDARGIYFRDLLQKPALT